MRKAYVIAARRTAIGRARGIYRSRTFEQLAAPVVKALLGDVALDPHEVDELIFGNALEGGNPARLVALAAGLPPTVPAMTIDRQCASGLDAVVEGCRHVIAGESHVVIAGGVESVSTAPWRVSRPTGRDDYPRFMARARFSTFPYPDPDMIPAAEAVAKAVGVSRRDQDEYAVRSHCNAIAAIAAGRFKDEVVSVFGSQQVETDECPKGKFTYNRVARFKPLIQPSGTVTAATCAPQADAAAAIVIASGAVASRLGVRHAMEFVGASSAGGDPAYPGLAAVPALHRLKERMGWSDWSQIAQVEFNEAFAGQALACLRQAGLPLNRVCPQGGALALGHPYGASGACLVVRLYHDAVRVHNSMCAQFYLASLSAAGGQGSAVVFKKSPA